MDQALSDLDNLSFLKSIETLATPEEKLKASIAFMRQALSQQKAPNFKGFWEVRRFSLPLFKEAFSGPLRAQLWEEYIELTREGRRLKNLLDEETDFAVTQIDLAIKALEDEIAVFQNNFESLLDKNDPFDLSTPPPQALRTRYTYFQLTHARLHFLKMYAGRINALRQELLRTEMRIRQKNKFFQRLSILGDFVFPTRKALINELSDCFTKDILDFIELNFSPKAFVPEKIKRSLFSLRDEIKSLQALAKVFTLNTQAFSVTREKLSESWDKLRELEKVIKKENQEQKQKSAENTQLVTEKIEQFRTREKEGTWSFEERMDQLNGIARYMRGIELTFSDLSSLKEELHSLRGVLDSEKEAKEKIQREKEAQVEKCRIEKVEQLKNAISSLKEKSGAENLEIFLTELEECSKKIGESSLTKQEKHQLERAVKDLRIELEEKKERSLLSDDDKLAVDQLKEIGRQRRERKKEIKQQIEEYRKIIGGSGLDIEKAMHYDHLMREEKQRLLKIEEGIQEVEQRIREITR